MKQISAPHTPTTSIEHPWLRFPNTRYLGSKRKLMPFLQYAFERLEFDRALDPFSGTASVAYLLKTMGKNVTAADNLQANFIAARALIQNNSVRLGTRVDALIADLPEDGDSPGFVESTFEGIFFERMENRFIDRVLPRAHALTGYRRDLALYALFQACLAKRPYNLFHRANLNMRKRNVPRSFGNKKTWDTPFSTLMKRYSTATDAAVCTCHPGQQCVALCSDVLDLDPSRYDFVYLDPPYISAKGAGVDYLDYYHFLEGLASPSNWGDRILHRYKHKPLSGRGKSPWCDPKRVGNEFEKVIRHYRETEFAISYRSDGIPSPDEICSFLKKAGKRVHVLDGGKYTYALSRNRRSREILFLGVRPHARYNFDDLAVTP